MMKTMTTVMTMTTMTNKITNRKTGKTRKTRKTTKKQAMTENYYHRKRHLAANDWDCRRKWEKQESEWKWERESRIDEKDRQVRRFSRLWPTRRRMQLSPREHSI